MFTDDEARDLLRQAADTIEVGPGRPVEPATSRRRSLLVALAAAAAVAVAAGSVAALTRSDGSADGGAVDGSPAGTPSTQASDPTAAQGPGTTAAPPDVLPAGVVPLVFGYDEEAALSRLRSADLRPDVVIERGCLAPGRAVRTEPAAGASPGPGSRVRLVVTAELATARCVRTDAVFWPLLDYARDVAASPELAPEVLSAVQGRVTTVSTPGERSAWADGSALDGVAALAELTERDPGEAPRQFGAGPDDGSGRMGCPGASAGQDPGLPDALAGRPSTAVWVRHQQPGEMGPCAVVNIFERGGAVDAVVVRTLVWQPRGASDGAEAG